MATETAKLLEVYADERGRILVGDSLTYVAEPARNDVVVCGSFAGSATVSIPLRQGVRGVIAHEAGVGKDGAGIGGLKLADRHGVPVAAVETMSARIADGDSLYRGKISQVNNVAAALGVQAGMLTADAAKLMLDAPVGSSAEIEGAVDEELHEMHASESGKIIAAWSILLVEGQQPNNVYCVASHSGETMAEFAKRVVISLANFR